MKSSRRRAYKLRRRHTATHRSHQRIRRNRENIRRQGGTMAKWGQSRCRAPAATRSEANPVRADEDAGVFLGGQRPRQSREIEMVQRPPSSRPSSPRRRGNARHVFGKRSGRIGRTGFRATEILRRLSSPWGEETGAGGRPTNRAGCGSNGCAPDNSPAIHGWGLRRAKGKSPARDGRKVLSSRTGLWRWVGRRPTTETVGCYFHRIIWDGHPTAAGTSFSVCQKENCSGQRPFASQEF